MRHSTHICKKETILLDMLMLSFLQLLDFVSMNRASRNQNNRSYVKGEEGWHKEAWAFLKVCILFYAAMLVNSY